MGQFGKNMNKHRIKGITIVIDANVELDQLEVLLSELNNYFRINKTYLNTLIHFILWNGLDNIELIQGNHLASLYNQVKERFKTIKDNHKDFNSLLTFMNHHCKLSESTFLITNGIFTYQNLDEIKQKFKTNFRKTFFWFVCENNQLDTIKQMDDAYQNRLVHLVDFVSKTV